MARVESEFDDVISKDHIYEITRAAQLVADRIAARHTMPDTVRLKISARTQKADAFIDYTDWKIVIDYNSLTVQKALIEKRALEGLLAHELMHMAQKADGTEDKLIKLFTQAFAKRGLGEESFDLMKNLAMIFKDVLVNDALVKEGFGEALFKDYFIIIHSRHREETLPFTELEAASVDNYFLALIGLLPAYASFYRQGKKAEGDALKALVTRHFSDIPAEIRGCVDGVEAAMLHASLTQKGIDAFVESALTCHARLLGD